MKGKPFLGGWLRLGGVFRACVAAVSLGGWVAPESIGDESRGAIFKVDLVELALLKVALVEISSVEIASVKVALVKVSSVEIASGKGFSVIDGGCVVFCTSERAGGILVNAKTPAWFGSERCKGSVAISSP